MPRSDGFDSTNERRAVSSWDSDDDEDSNPDIEAEAARREAAREAFYDQVEEERTMAAMRGALAAGKRLPSREALAALEIVKIEDLKESDRSRPPPFPFNFFYLPTCLRSFRGLPLLAGFSFLPSGQIA